MKKRSNLQVFRPMTISISHSLSAKIMRRYLMRVSLRQSNVFADHSNLSENNHFYPFALFEEPLKSQVSELAHSHIASKAMSAIRGEPLDLQERRQNAKLRFLGGIEGQIEDMGEEKRHETMQAKRFDEQMLFPETAPSIHVQSTLRETEMQTLESGEGKRFRSLSSIASYELHNVKVKTQAFKPNTVSCDSPINNDIFERELQSQCPTANYCDNFGNVKNSNRSAIDAIGKFATKSKMFVTRKPLKSSILLTPNGLTGDVLKCKNALFSLLFVDSKSSEVLSVESKENGSNECENLISGKPLFSNRNQEARDSHQYDLKAVAARQMMRSLDLDVSAQEAINEYSREDDSYVPTLLETIQESPNLAREFQSSVDACGSTLVGNRRLNSPATKRRLQHEFFPGIAQMPAQSLEGVAFVERTRKRLEAERAGRR